MALVHIFVNVPDSLDRGKRLHIDMAPILPDEIWRVANHSLIVDLIALNFQNLACVTMPGASIRVFMLRLWTAYGNATVQKRPRTYLGIPLC